jgi:15-cis-phytoene synthase
MQPISSKRGFASPAELALSREMIRTGSKSFHLASLLLPQRVREPGRALYGFCRMADDAVDQTNDARAAVDQLSRRLDLIYDGRPGPDPTDRAFADVASRFGIPRALPEALIEGFAWDAEGRNYASFSDLKAYAVRVAGTVGGMMSLLMGVRDQTALARATDLGVAMQLSNIARDVEEDARNGRLYLPLEWLDEAKLEAKNVLERPSSASQIATRLVHEADELYARAATGIRLLPRSCRASIHAARLLYAEIGHEARRRQHEGRAVVPSWRKFTLVMAAMPAALSRATPSSLPALPEAQFLLDAVASGHQPWTRVKTFDDRLEWLAGLFVALKDKDRGK